MSRPPYAAVLAAAWAEHLAPRGDAAATVVSLFAGCGGSSLGYRMAGFREVLAVEWDPNAAASFRANFPDVPLWQGDVGQLTDELALEMAGLRPGELDVLDGSPPCQGFSTAGRRIFEDPRNALFREHVRLLRAFRPRALVLENVSGMVKGKMKLVFAEILRELRACGYRVSCRLLDAQWFDVPQSRQRVIFVGLREDLETDPRHPRPRPRARFWALRDVLPSLMSSRSQRINPWMGGDGPAATLCATAQGYEATAILHTSSGGYQVEATDRPMGTLTESGAYLMEGDPPPPGRLPNGAAEQIPIVSAHNGPGRAEQPLDPSRPGPALVADAGRAGRQLRVDGDPDGRQAGDPPLEAKVTARVGSNPSFHRVELDTGRPSPTLQASGEQQRFEVEEPRLSVRLEEPARVLNQRPGELRDAPTDRPSPAIAGGAVSWGHSPRMFVEEPAGGDADCWGVSSAQGWTRERGPADQSTSGVDEPAPAVRASSQMWLRGEAGSNPPPPELTDRFGQMWDEVPEGYSAGEVLATRGEISSWGGRPHGKQSAFKVRQDTPSRSLPSVQTGRGTMTMVHPTVRRALTIEEAKIIGSFPEAFVLLGTYQQRWARIGNSVPPLLMRAIARDLAALLRGQAPPADDLHERAGDLLRATQEIRLPDPHDQPAQLEQPLVDEAVPGDVPLEIAPPEVDAGLRDAAAAVPEVAVDERRDPATPKRQVRRAGKPAVAHAIPAQPGAADEAAQQQLGAGVPGADPPHDPRADLGRDAVHGPIVAS